MLLVGCVLGDWNYIIARHFNVINIVIAIILYLLYLIRLGLG